MNRLPIRRWFRVTRRVRVNEEGERREDMEKGNPRISKAALFSSPFLLSDKGITTERERERRLTAI